MEKEMSLNIGDLVRVPCSIQLGPFPDELLVTVETEDGPISGFVKQGNLEVSDPGQDHGYVKGTVVATAPESIRVQLFGSFFTTALGIASVRKDNLTRIAA
jgi:hypothetical protein